MELEEAVAQEVEGEGVEGEEVEEDELQEEEKDTSRNLNNDISYISYIYIIYDNL